MPKKTLDGKRWISLYKEKPIPRQAPDYDKTTIHHQDPDCGCCGFNHAPYSSNLKYVDSTVKKSLYQPQPEGADFEVWTTVAHLASGAKSCAFCRILWLGLQRHRHFWEAKWACLMGLDYLYRHISAYTVEEYNSIVDQVVRGELRYRDLPVDESKIYFKVSLPRKKGYVQVRLLIEPRGKSTWDSNRLLMAFDYHTLHGRYTLQSPNFVF